MRVFGALMTSVCFGLFRRFQVKLGGEMNTQRTCRVYTYNKAAGIVGDGRHWMKKETLTHNPKSRPAKA